MNIIWENKTENFIKAENAMVQAGSNGADIIFFPEMSFTGFSMNIGSTAENDFFTFNKDERAMYKIQYCSRLWLGKGVWQKSTKLLYGFKQQR